MAKTYRIYVMNLSIEEIEIDDETLEELGDENNNPDFHSDILDIAEDEFNSCESEVDRSVKPEEV